MLFLSEEEQEQLGKLDGDSFVTEPPNELSTEEKRARGQPSLVSKFQEIVEITAEFIKQHIFSTQALCQSDTGNLFGVAAKQIQEHLYKMIPDLNGHTIYNMTSLSCTQGQLWLQWAL